MNISSDDWQRMSWYARQKFLKRFNARPFLEGERTPIRVKVVPDFNQGIVRRCGECGAWMIDVCNTDHGSRYES